MNTYSRTKNSIINFTTGIVGQTLISILGFVTKTVFIHTLGKSYLGITGLFSNVLTMLSLTELGFDTAITFKLYKPLADKDEKRIRVLLKFYKTAYRVVGCVIFVLGICIIPLLPLLIKDYPSLGTLGINATLIFILYLLQSVSTYLFFSWRTAVAIADQKQYLLNISGFAATIVLNITQILILLIWKDFIAYTVSTIVVNLFHGYINARITKHFYPYAFIKEEESISFEEVKDIYKDLGALFVYKVNWVVLKATDNMILSAYSGLLIVGMYSNYLTIYSIIGSFLQKLFGSVKASMGNLFATGTIKEKYKFFNTMNFLSALLYGTGCIGIAVVANEFIEVWIGEDYVIPQPFPILIGIECLFTGIKNNLGQVRNISGTFRQMWFRPVMGVIVNLGVSIALVQMFGIYGVIIGTIVADFLTNFMVDPRVIHKYVFDNYRPVSQYYIQNAKYAALLILIGGIDYFICSHYFINMGWISVAIHALICGISVIGGFCFVFRNEEECIYLIGKIKNICFRNS